MALLKKDLQFSPNSYIFYIIDFLDFLFSPGFTYICSYMSQSSSPEKSYCKAYMFSLLNLLLVY